ncbi:leucine-rich repeat protein [uncultured Eubacterium sp.]|uniref:leucine-rich repeat protein n=1 Tax=uncultured Eubacterium sp. TaxID=165185 RepID=UPI0025F79C22|nr:leucine-rich repeat protein [uncultured Eubacterium sp.]
MKKSISVILSVIIMICSLSSVACAFAQDERRVYEGTTTCYNIAEKKSHYSYNYGNIEYTDYRTVTYYFTAESDGVYLIKLPASYDSGGLQENDGSNYTYLKKGESYPFSYNTLEYDLITDLNINSTAQYKVTISKLESPFEYADDSGDKYTINPQTMTAEITRLYASKKYTVKDSIFSCAITSIGEYAFENNTSLTELTLPKTITYIGSYAFSSCTHLQKVMGVAKDCKFGNQIFLGCPNSAAVYDYEQNILDSEKVSTKPIISKPSEKVNTKPIISNPSEKEDENSDTEVTVSKPTLKSVKAIKKGHKIKVSWNKVSNASGYQVCWYKDKKCKKTVAKKNINNANTTTYSGKGFAKGKKYYVRVRAYKKVNGSKIYGKKSNIKSVKAK